MYKHRRNCLIEKSCPSEKKIVRIIYSSSENPLLRYVFSPKRKFYSKPTKNVLSQQNNFTETVKKFI